MGKNKSVRFSLDSQIMGVARAAASRGEALLAAALISLGSVYLSANKNYLAGLAKHIEAMAKLALQGAELDEKFPPALSGGDPLGDKIEAAAEVAHAARNFDAAAALTSFSAVHLSGNKEVMRKLAEAASSLSSEAVGRRPAKAVLLIENDLSDLGDDPKRPNEGLMGTDFA